MARYQRVWLRVVERKQGRMWQLRYNAVHPANGKKKEQTTIVGSLAIFPTESACWREADRQWLTEKINQPEVQTKRRFRQIADFYMNHTVFGELAHTTQYLHKHVINDYLVARWADEFALELRGLAVEEWLHSLSKDEGGELEGPTLGKLKQVMIVILRHAEKYGHLPTGFATELGKQISISTSSDYEAVILTPEQTMTILSYMRQPERTLTLLIAAQDCGGRKSPDFSGRTLIGQGAAFTLGVHSLTARRRSVSRRRNPSPPSQWLLCSLASSRSGRGKRRTLRPRIGYSPLIKEKGRIPRVGNMLVSDYLRPAAIKAGVLRVAEDGTVYDAGASSVKQFGFHNLRHSLSTTLLTEEREDLRTVQDMMRHSTSSTTLDLYTQSSMQQRIAAQEKLLSRILPQSELVN